MDLSDVFCTPIRYDRASPATGFDQALSIPNA
jgi:hypothetical protein